MRRPLVDLRLVPGALAAWCAGLLVAHAPGLGAVLGALLAGLVVLLLVAASAGARVRTRGAVRGSSPPHLRRPGPLVPGPVARSASSTSGTRGGPLTGAALVCAVGAAVLVSGAVQQAPRAPEPLVVAAAHGRAVEAVGRVEGDVRRLDGGDRAGFTVHAGAVRVAGRWLRVDAPVVVTAGAAPPVGALVRVRGVASPPRPRDGTASLRVAGDAEVVAPPGRVSGWVASVRDGAAAVADDLPPDARGLLPAVTVGATAGVPEDLVAAMRTAGLAHVTAVSGAHFAILGALVLAVASALRAPRLLQGAAVAVAGTGLLLVVGPEPSVVRAAVMGAVGLLGLVLGRRAPGPAALAAAVVGLLLADPWLAVSIGFSLSVAATAGLVLLGPALAERLAGLVGRTVGATLAAPVAAQLGCLPVALAVWPTFGPWAVLANVAVAPVVGPATVLGLVAAGLHGPLPAVAGMVGAAAGAACWWIATVARVVAGWPGAEVAWWSGTGGALSATAAVVACGALLLRERSGR